MEIEYLDADARLAGTSPGARPDDWTDAEVSRFRLIVQCVQAGQAVGDVLTLRSLRLRPDRDDPGRATTDLSPDRAVTLTFKPDASPITALLDIVHQNGLTS
jgi:hypothetical protein